ncbi:MAG: ThiF family adenylyltransferase, partial [Nitrososphaerota archaeon]
MVEEFTDKEFEMYSRQIVLSAIGYQGQEKLKKGRVAVVGVGGLGSPVATLLTAMGVGYIRIIDRDIVEVSNLHRQHLY